jgi:D-amino-acid oxidase
MAYLYQHTQKGLTPDQVKITGDLLKQEDQLLSRYSADAIVNATGLGAFDLAADKTATSLRGALIRVVNDGTKLPKVAEALAVSRDESHGAEAEDIMFIVPRNENVLVLGGTPSGSSHPTLRSSILRPGPTTW